VSEEKEIERGSNRLRKIERDLAKQTRGKETDSDSMRQIENAG